MNSRQTFPYKIRKELPVIHPVTFARRGLALTEAISVAYAASDKRNNSPRKTKEQPCLPSEQSERGCIFRSC
jgi:hypothetical protein